MRWVIVMAAVLAACSSGGGSPDAGSDPADAGSAPADAGPYLAAADYCASVVDAYCPYYLRCGRMVANDVDECRATFLETCQGRYQPRYEALEQAGLLRLTRDGVAACSAHLAAVECSRQIRDLDGPCASLWLGTQPAGAGCGIDVESLVCAPGASCVVGLDLCGTCRQEAAIGDACGGQSVCNANAASCQDGVCVARAPPGEDCSTRPCVLGAWCEGGVCVAPAVVGAGEACDARRRCAYRSTCSGGTCRLSALLGGACGTGTACASGTCVDGACAPLRGAGEACTAADQCVSMACSAGRCAAYPDACIGRDGGP